MSPKLILEYSVVSCNNNIYQYLTRSCMHAQLWQTLCGPTGCGPPGSSVHGSMQFPRQDCWSRLPFPSPGDLPNPAIESASPVPPALMAAFFITEPPGKSDWHNESLLKRFCTQLPTCDCLTPPFSPMAPSQSPLLVSSHLWALELPVGKCSTVTILTLSPVSTQASLLSSGSNCLLNRPPLRHAISTANFTRPDTSSQFSPPVCSFLKRERERQVRQRRCDAKTRGNVRPLLKRGHGPRNAGSLWKLEKAKDRFPVDAPDRTQPCLDFSSDFRLQMPELQKNKCALFEPLRL